MSTIFVSHSSKDVVPAEEVKAALRAWGYRSIFLDFDPADGIPAGREWERDIYARLRQCRAMVVLCSPHSMTSPWCFAEITHAKALGKAIFPIKVAACTVHGLLTPFQALDLTGDAAARAQALERLASGLRAAGLDLG